MSAVRAEETAFREPPRSEIAAVLAQLRRLPQVRLEPRSATQTAVVFHARTLAVIDSGRQVAEIAGLTVHLTSPADARAAVALIDHRRDEISYRWQAATASP